MRQTASGLDKKKQTLKNLYQDDYEEGAFSSRIFPKVTMSFEDAWQLTVGLNGEERRQRMKTLAMLRAQDEYGNTQTKEIS